MLCPFLLMGQSFYRYKSDFSIKEKLPNGSYRLTMGKVYYDKVYKKIVYKLSFPKQETLVIQDTLIYHIDKNNKLVSKTRSVLMPEFTIFHLALSNSLGDYGLKPKPGEKALYRLSKVEKKPEGIISTWSPSEPQLKKIFGDIMMRNVNKNLDAMIFYDTKGKVLSTQNFKKYISVKGIAMPTEVSMVNTNSKNERIVQLSTYKNIEIDRTDENEVYRYKIPLPSTNSKK
jgi:hypothetical protein